MEGVLTYLGLAGGVAAHTIEGGSLNGRLGQRSTESRAAQSQRGGHCDDILIEYWEEQRSFRGQENIIQVFDECTTNTKRSAEGKARK